MTPARAWPRCATRNHSLPIAAIAPTDVIATVCAAWSVDPNAVIAGYRGRRVVLARRSCVVALHRIFYPAEMSLADIGGYLGGLDHSTVLYALKAAGVSP